MRAAVTALAVSLFLAGCGELPAAGSGGLNVVAAENVWGSIAAQLAGTKASVRSIIVNPAQDPHSYDPTAQDGRALATAQLAIVNGIGYDPWATRLLNANPDPRRYVLDVGHILGLHEGDNPHRWYDPANVIAVAERIESDLTRLDGHDAGYFAARLKAFTTTGLAGYRSLIAQIGSRYGGVAVGASESIFALQAPALSLRLVTPASFMRAISEGTDPTAQDIATIQHQIASRQLRVWIYNSQNATPLIQRFNALARARGIPVVTITETLDPSTASFAQWQLSQLQRIAQALHRVTGR